MSVNFKNMNFGRVLLSGVIVGAVFTTGVAHATTLSAVQGAVLLDQGQGFKAINGAVHLKSGDAVMVQTGGSARLQYADGCTVAAAVGIVTTIGQQSPCAARANLPKPSYSGVYDPQNSKEAPAASDPGAAGGIGPGVAVVAGIAVVGGIIAIAAATKNRGGRPSPASP